MRGPNVYRVLEISKRRISPSGEGRGIKCPVPGGPRIRYLCLGGNLLLSSFIVCGIFIFPEAKFRIPNPYFFIYLFFSLLVIISIR